jgi:peptidoglycan/LPS O-acetylase OafA/YrhL
MVYIPLSITTMLLISRLLSLSHQWIINIFAFIGGISLELYLVHIHYVLNFLTPLHLGYTLTAIMMIAISVLMAWPLHLAAKWIMNLNKKH